MQKMKFATLALALMAWPAFATPTQKLECTGQISQDPNNPVANVKIDLQFQTTDTAADLTLWLQMINPPNSPWMQECASTSPFAVTSSANEIDFMGDVKCNDGSGGPEQLVFDTQAMTLSAVNGSERGPSYSCQWM
jgi:hypothetical protein